MLNSKIHFSIISFFSLLVITASFLIIKFDSKMLSGLAIALLTTLGAIIHSLSLACSVVAPNLRKIAFFFSSVCAQSIIPILLLFLISRFDIKSDSIVAIILIGPMVILCCGIPYFFIVKHFLLPKLEIISFIRCLVFCQISLIPILFIAIFDPPNFLRSTEVSRFSIIIASPIIWWYAFSLGLINFKTEPKKI